VTTGVSFQDISANAKAGGCLYGGHSQIQAVTWVSGPTDIVGKWHFQF
jgi:hypothetical protein